MHLIGEMLRVVKRKAAAAMNYNVKKLHHKREKNSVAKAKCIISQTLVWRVANRLRKNLCQDLLSRYESVIL
jgi:hypothetical protein